MSKDLAKLRAQIDAIDKRLLGTLNERARVAKLANEYRPAVRFQDDETAPRECEGLHE